MFNSDCIYLNQWVLSIIEIKPNQHYPEYFRVYSSIPADKINNTLYFAR